MMITIARNPELAAQENYDLIVVGGGIYGVTLSWEATLRGLRPLLLEQADFGGATSLNSLKTLHGGFRYLQSFDLWRFFESVRERNWFLQNFSDLNLVRPLPCLLPLYGKGLRRPLILQQALQINTILAARYDGYLPRGTIISPQRTQAIFPLVNPQELKGGAIWYDAFMPNSQRLLIEILKAACSKGARALNYMRAEALLTKENQVTGIVALDQETGKRYEYRAKVVINAAGPWSAEVADNLDGRQSSLYKNCLAWNILFNREAVSDFAVAIAPNRPKAKTYFAHNWKGKLLIGTGNAPYTSRLTKPVPTDSQLKDFITDINDAVPQLKLNLTDIAQVLAGFRPVKTPKTIRVADRELIMSHERYGGAVGLYSVAGVKFTTARLVAEKTLKRIFPDLATPLPITIREVMGESLQSTGVFTYDWYPDPNDLNWQKQILSLMKEEAAQHLDDLIFRRTSLGDNLERVSVVAPQICQLLGWNLERSQQELSRVESYVASRQAKSNNCTNLYT